MSNKTFVVFLMFFVLGWLIIFAFSRLIENQKKIVENQFALGKKVEANYDAFKQLGYDKYREDYNKAVMKKKRRRK